jgi:hypothetical protein
MVDKLASASCRVDSRHVDCWHSTCCQSTCCQSTCCQLTCCQSTCCQLTCCQLTFWQSTCWESTSKHSTHKSWTMSQQQQKTLVAQLTHCRSSLRRPAAATEKATEKANDRMKILRGIIFRQRFGSQYLAFTRTYAFKTHTCTRDSRPQKAGMNFEVTSREHRRYCIMWRRLVASIFNVTSRWKRGEWFRYCCISSIDISL